MKSPYMIILIFTAGFTIFSLAGYTAKGIGGAIPGIIGLLFQIPFALWIRRKMK